MSDVSIIESAGHFVEACRPFDFSISSEKTSLPKLVDEGGADVAAITGNSLCKVARIASISPALPDNRHNLNQAKNQPAHCLFVLGSHPKSTGRTEAEDCAGPPAGPGCGLAQCLNEVHRSMVSQAVARGDCRCRAFSFSFASGPVTTSGDCCHGSGGPFSARLSEYLPASLCPYISPARRKLNYAAS